MGVGPDLTVAFRYIGNVSDLAMVAGQDGDVCICDGVTYVWVGHWSALDSPDNDQSTVAHDVKVSTCPHCAAALPLTRVDDSGICTCEYCGSPVYIW